VHDFNQQNFPTNVVVGCRLLRWFSCRRPPVS